MNLYCKIYVDTDFKKATVFESIQQKVVGKLGDPEQFFKLCNMGLLKNDNFHVRKRNEIPNGYFFSRYLLEIEPRDGVIPEEYIPLVAGVLEGLWDLKYKAAVSCDFEELLPNQGGR